MKNKLINKIINVIIFIIPILIIPDGITNLGYNFLKIVVLLFSGIILSVLLFLKRKEIKLDLIDKTLLIFYLLIVITTILSVNLPKAIIGEWNRYEGLLTFTIYFLVYYFAKYYYSYNKNIKFYAIATMLFCSIIGILQYYNLFPLYDLFNIPHVEGIAPSTFGNRNFFGSFLAIRCTFICRIIFS